MSVESSATAASSAQDSQFGVALQEPLVRKRLVRHPATDLVSTTPLEDTHVTMPIAPAGWYAVQQPERPIGTTAPRVTFELLQRWEGTVQRVEEDDVQVILVDKTRASEDEIATLALEDFSPADRELVVPGAVFYWTIGYRTVAGTRRRESFFSVRRRPTHTAAVPARQMERARKEAAVWFDLFAKPSEE